MEKERKLAIDSVSKACALTKAIQQEKSMWVINKEDKSPVTVADFSSQLLITYYLQKVFPDLRLIAEENILELREREKKVFDQISIYLSRYIPDYSFDSMVAQQERLQNLPVSNKYWVLDPIDGTKGFLRGEQFAVALALIEDGVPVLGVIGCPNLNKECQPEGTGPGVIAYAVLGNGAWIQKIDGLDDPVRLSVSNCSDAANASFVASVESSHSNNDTIMALKAHLNNKEDIHQFDSQAKYVMVAAGKFDAFIRQPPANNPGYHEKVWDHAAGALIVQEAGGMVTDLYGKVFDFSQGNTLVNNYGVIVSNGHFHQTMVAYFNENKNA